MTKTDANPPDIGIECEFSPTVALLAAGQPEEGGQRLHIPFSNERAAFRAPTVAMAALIKAVLRGSGLPALGVKSLKGPEGNEVSSTLRLLRMRRLLRPLRLVLTGLGSPAQKRSRKR